MKLTPTDTIELASLLCELRKQLETDKRSFYAVGECFAEQAREYQYAVRTLRTVNRWIKKLKVT